jgi:competence ComEA-like helix-hairpin-helix protein
MNFAALRPSLASLRCMIALAAIAVGFGVWEASRRQASVDDALAGASSSPWPDMRVDLNTASAAELALLPGIGAGLSERIVRDREANGPFATIQDLQRVPGLGETIINRLWPHAVAIPTK